MKRSKETAPTLVLQTLSVRWLQSFETAARAQNRTSILDLFSPLATIYGLEKDGAMDWPMPKKFEWDMESSRIVPTDPYSLVISPWRAASDVLGGPTRIGFATFFLGLEQIGEGRKRFVCYHAHFSNGTSQFGIKEKE